MEQQISHLRDLDTKSIEEIREISEHLGLHSQMTSGSSPGCNFSAGETPLIFRRNNDIRVKNYKDAPLASRPQITTDENSLQEPMSADSNNNSTQQDLMPKDQSSKQKLSETLVSPF